MKLTLIASAALLAAPGFAAVLYDNGAPSGLGGGAPQIRSALVVDSFLLSGDATVNGVANVGLWMTGGTLPQSVDWYISSSPFGGILTSATSSWSSTIFLFTNGFGFDIYSTSIVVPDIHLTAGKYYLGLTNAVASAQGTTFWDRSNGPSEVFDGSTNVSNAFQIVGTLDSQSGVPEPSSFLLAALGALGLFAVRRDLSKKPGAGKTP